MMMMINSNSKRSKILLAVYCAVFLFPMLSAGDETSKACRQQYNFAIGLYQKGLYETAASEFDRFVNECPDAEIVPGALYWLSQSQVESKQYNAAEATLQKLLSDYPEDEKTEYALFQLGRTYFLKKEYERSFITFKDLQTRFSAGKLFLEAEYYKGLTLVNRGKYTKAKNIFASIIKFFENREERNDLIRKCKIKLAYSQEKLGLYNEAADLLLELRNSSTGEEDIAQSLQKLGEVYFAQKSYDKALQAFTELVESYPAAAYSDRAYYYRGITFLKTGDSAAASKDFLYILEHFTDSVLYPDTARKLGDIYLNKKKFTEAKKYYTILLNPASPPSIVRKAEEGIGWAFFNEDNFEDAIEHFKKAMSDTTSPSTPKIEYMIAESYFRLEKYTEAKKYYKHVVREYPASDIYSDAVKGLGWCAFKTGDYQEAIDNFKQLRSTGTPENRAHLYFLIGTSYYNGKKYYDSRQWYRDTFEKFPETRWAEKAYRSFIESFYLTKEYEKGIRHANDFIKKFDDSKLLDGIYWRLGFFEFYSARYNNAIDDFRKVFEFPESSHLAQSQFLIGECFFNIEKYDSALSAYSKTEEKYPDSDYVDKALYSSAIALFQLQKYDKAIEKLSNLLERFPETELEQNARRLLAQILTRQNRIKEAEQILRDIGTAEATFQLGIMAYENHNLSEALGFFEAVIGKKQEFIPESMEYIGKIYAEKKEYDKSVNIFERIEKGFADYPNIHNVRFEKALSLTSLKKYSDAVKVFESLAAAGSPNMIAAQLNIGKIYNIQQKYDNAIIHFKKVTEYADKAYAPEAHMGIAAAYIGLQNVKNAIPELLKVYMLYGASNWAPQALEQAAELDVFDSRIDKAKKLYKLLVKDYPGYKTKQVKKRLKELKGNYPTP